MSSWNQYEGFSKLAKKFGGPNNLIMTVFVGGGLTTLAATAVVHAVKKKLSKGKDEIRLSSLKDYKRGEVDIKQGDIITVGSIYNNIALIKINDSDDPYYVLFSELLKIAKKTED